jgi:hypothetical protein
VSVEPKPQLTGSRDARAGVPYVGRNRALVAAAARKRDAYHRTRKAAGKAMQERRRERIYFFQVHHFQF